MLAGMNDVSQSAPWSPATWNCSSLLMHSVQKAFLSDYEVGNVSLSHNGRLLLMVSDE
jgi:hypothetical protein